MEVQEHRRKNAERKLGKLRKKAQKKVLKYQKRMEKIRRRAEKKAKKYATIERQLIIAAKPQVGDPILPEDALLPEADEAPVGKAELEKSKRRLRREEEEKRKEEQKRIARGDFTMYERFETASFEDLETRHIKAKTREERIFYRTILNLKLQIEQEKVIGEELL